MGKRFSFAIALGALIVALSAAPAAAVGELDSCLRGSDLICQIDGASINDTSATNAVLQEAGVRVVVVPNDGVQTNSGRYADDLAANYGISELIVVVDGKSKDTFAVHTAGGNKDEISNALNTTGKADAGEAIASVDLSSFYDEPAAQGSGGSDGGGVILPVLIGIVLGSAAIYVGISAIKSASRRRAKALSAAPTYKAIQAQKSVQISEELRSELTKISKTLESYERSSNQDLTEAAALLRPVHSHIFELFARIDRKNSKQNREIAQVRYLDILRKLNSTLSKDYFEDIVQNPNLWENSGEKVATVFAALRSVDRQIIENIKQVNSSKEIEVQVAMERLLGSEETSVDEAFGEAQPDTEGPEDRKRKLHFLR